MGRLLTRHGLCGWLLASLLVLGLLTPTIDAFLCIADAAGTSESAIVLAEKSGPEKQPATHDDGDALCVHGHCHHWVGVARLAERPSFQLALNFSMPSFPLSDVSPSSLQTDMFRPPRA